MLNLPKLNDLLAYENEFVVAQFIQDHPGMSLEQGKQIFSDLLRWMWLSIYRKQKNLETHLFGPLLGLDKMWHVFILNTHAYMKFCQHYFSDYFHHEVEPIGQAKELNEDELSDFLSDCYDTLGEDWLKRNFQMLLV